MLDLWFKWENLPNTKKYYYFCLQCRGTRGVLNSVVSEDYNLQQLNCILSLLLSCYDLSSMTFSIK